MQRSQRSVAPIESLTLLLGTDTTDYRELGGVTPDYDLDERVRATRPLRPRVE